MGRWWGWGGRGGEGGGEGEKEKEGEGSGGPATTKRGTRLQWRERSAPLMATRTRKRPTAKIGAQGSQFQTGRSITGKEGSAGPTWLIIRSILLLAFLHTYRSCYHKKNGVVLKLKRDIRYRVVCA